MIKAILLSMFLILPNNYPSFDEAVSNFKKNEKPIMILVTADWCQPCQNLKSEVLNPMIANGELKDVNFGVVNLSHKNRQEVLDFVSKKHTSVPRIIFYYPNFKTGKWSADYIVGYSGYNTTRNSILSKIRKLK